MNNSPDSQDSTLEEARTSFVFAGLDQLKDKYSTLPLKKKRVVQKGLEAILNQLERDKWAQYSPLEGKPHWDYNQARLTRENAGLNRKELIRLLGLNENAYVQVSYWELGRNRPGNPPKGRVTLIYLNWLKERGYNPYNLPL